MLLVCAGLQNTPDVLFRYKLSRKADESDHAIGTLAPGEGREVLSKTMDRLGLRLENPHWRQHLRKSKRHMQSWEPFRESLINELERDCADFPQHLTAGIMSVCNVFDEKKDQFGPAHDAEIISQVRGQLARRKGAYYKNCLGDALRPHRTALGAIAQAAQVEGAISRNRATMSIKAAANCDIEDDEEALAFSEAKEILDLALQRGILQSDDTVEDDMSADEVLPSAIPSMNNHLTGRFGMRLESGHPAAIAAAKSLCIIA